VCALSYIQTYIQFAKFDKNTHSSYHSHRHRLLWTIVLTVFFLEIKTKRFAFINYLSLSGNKEVMSVYSEIITETARYYCPLLPTNTGRAKCAFDNIGRTIVEKYPVLAVKDAKITWSYFNSKLSSALRNMRCRIKQKLSGQSTASLSKKSCYASVSATDAASAKLSEEEYLSKRELLKKESLKTLPDDNHCKMLLKTT